MNEQKQDFDPFNKRRDELMATPDYINWQNDLIAEADKEAIKINPAHNDALIGIFVLRAGETPAASLRHYKDFCRRWKALNKLKPC